MSDSATPPDFPPPPPSASPPPPPPPPIAAPASPSGSPPPPPPVSDAAAGAVPPQAPPPAPPASPGAGGGDAGSGEGGDGSGSGKPKWVFAVAAVVVLALVGVVVVLLTGGSDSDDPAAVPTDETTIVLDDTVAPTTDESDDVEPPSTDVLETTPTTDEPLVPPVGPSGRLVDGAPDGLLGDRTTPVPPGQFADAGNGWRVQIVDIVDDDTTRLVDDGFTEPPPAGSRYTVVTVRLGYYGIDDPISAFEVQLSAVGADDVELDDGCSFSLLSPIQSGEFFAGGVATGELCFTTTEQDAAALQIYASDFRSDEVFLDASTSDPAAVALPTLQGPQPGAASTPGRLAPEPIGTTVDVGEDWSVTVLGPATDITDQIVAEGSFNAPPPGQRLVGFPVEVGYNGAGTGSMFDVRIGVVHDGNVAGERFCGFFEDELDDFADVFAGGKLTGTVCASVPETEVASVMAYASTGFDTTPFFFDLGGSSGAAAPAP